MASGGEILLQPFCPLLFLLQGLSQLHRAAFRRLFQLAGFLARLGGKCGLRLDIMASGGEILLQPLCPLLFLLLGFSQPDRAAFRRLLDLRSLLRARRIGLGLFLLPERQ